MINPLQLINSILKEHVLFWSCVSNHKQTLLKISWKFLIVLLMSVGREIIVKERNVIKLMKRNMTIENITMVKPLFKKGTKKTHSEHMSNFNTPYKITLNI